MTQVKLAWEMQLHLSARVAQPAASLSTRLSYVSSVYRRKQRQHLGPPLVLEVLEHHGLVGRLPVDKVLLALLCPIYPRPATVPSCDNIRL
jgi:hypothetical protein